MQNAMKTTTTAVCNSAFNDIAPPVLAGVGAGLVALAWLEVVVLEGRFKLMLDGAVALGVVPLTMKSQP